MQKNILRRVYRKLRRVIFSAGRRDHSDLNLFLKKGEISKIEQLPRRTEASTKLFEKTIFFPDGYWFLHSMNEIFVEEVYRFQSEIPNPYIIDCGANIGLSVIYFKRLFPSASIVAFEPDQKIYKTLVSNISQFNFDNVQLINKGLWNDDTTISFFAEGTLGGRVVEKEEARTTNVVTIETLRLKDYLKENVDFLKIDIEGAEYEVLVDSAVDLKNVRLLFVEYHSTSTLPQKLNEILTIITNAGFRYCIRETAPKVRFPFLKTKRDWFDLQLNIFCYRD
jgi:FkbM family methyltransferase